MRPVHTDPDVDSGRVLDGPLGPNFSTFELPFTKGYVQEVLHPLRKSVMSHVARIFDRLEPRSKARIGPPRASNWKH
jgi:hypothetical protein